MVAVLDHVDAHRVAEGRVREDGALGPDWRGAHGYGMVHSLTAKGAERELRLAGEGAFSIAEFAVCEVAAALGMSETSARRYVGQLIELRDRLPRLHARVVAGDLPVWKARQIAQETIPLNAAAAAYVYRHLERYAHKLSPRRIEKAVHAAALDRKSTRLNSSHANTSYAVFCLRKKIRQSLRHTTRDRFSGTSAACATCPTPRSTTFLVSTRPFTPRWPSCSCLSC